MMHSLPYTFGRIVAYCQREYSLGLTHVARQAEANLKTKVEEPRIMELYGLDQTDYDHCVELMGGRNGKYTGNKVAAVRLIRMVTHCSLRQAVDIADAIKKDNNIQ